VLELEQSDVFREGNGNTLITDSPPFLMKKTQVPNHFKKRSFIDRSALMSPWLSMNRRIFASVLACFAASVALIGEEEQPEVLYSTPNGA